VGLRIRSIGTSAGFLEKAPVEFADGLTCIIGARGTCKSTVVETIRFLFACDARRVDALLGKNLEGTAIPGHFGLIKATLAGGTARALVTDQGPLAIERHVDQDAPQVVRDKVKELTGPPVIERVEVFSQGDLQRIAEDYGRRLDLIDRPNKARIDELLARRRESAQQLRELGLQLRATRAKIEARKTEVAGLGLLNEQLRTVQGQRPDLSPQLETERQGFLQRRARLDRAAEIAMRRDQLLEVLKKLAESESDVRTVSAELRGLDAAGAPQLASVLASFADLLGQTGRAAQAQKAIETAPLLAELRRAFEEKDASYQKLQQEQKDVNDSLKAEDKLRGEIGRLQSLAKELQASLETEKELAAKRTKRRTEVVQLGDEIYNLRKQEVDRVNARHEGVILLTLTQGTRSVEYRATLDRLLQGSRLRSQTEIARDLAQKVTPGDLIEAIETGDSPFLATHLERDKAQMTKLVAFLVDSSGLYDLESVGFEDQLEITMFVDGVAKPVQQLSKGQMATALLPLVLRDSEDPLIFDQPEDDLDNRYIFQTLVARIRELKAKRQLIFVTHNANIPVLGEADKVVVMHMENPQKAAAPLHGNVDEMKDAILALLEGGAEAFKLRQKRYGPLVK
jgi:ABC-type enterochelin transport system ATPase subunit